MAARGTPALVAAALPLTGCVDPTQGPGEGQASPGEGAGATAAARTAQDVVIAAGSEPDSLNPVLGYARWGDGKVFEGLVRLTADLTVEPVLAQTLPEVSDDGLTVVFTPRDGVTFHDGTPLTADDVVFTYESALDPAHASPRRRPLLDPGPGVRERIRGRVAAWLPQSPVSAMTPVLTVGHHLVEKARVHADGAAPAQDLLARAMERHRVDPGWWRRLPSQLSGGQAQRVSNALALLGDPGLVLADEPTAGLDRELARRTGQVLRALAHEEHRAVLVVTHDLTLAEEIADDVVLLDAGVSSGPTGPEELARRRRAASHARVHHGPVAPPRTAARAGHGEDARVARGESAGPGQGERARLGLSGVGLTITRGRGHVVRRGVDVRVAPDTTTGLQAPSGAGKTTLLRTLALLHAPAAGHVELDGRVLHGTGHRVPAAVRRAVGYVPQDPRQAVDPRWTLGRTLLEPVRLGRGARLRALPHTHPDAHLRTHPDTDPAADPDATLVARLLERVGLPPELGARRPEEVSGGQLQRVVLARALAMDPDYLLLDEPTSMVDAASAQAVVAAVHAHQHATGCGVLVASHDEELLRTWCDEVLRWAD